MMIKLYNDDCLKVMDELVKERVKFDLVLADPPYGTIKQHGIKWDNTLDLNKVWNLLKLLRHDRTPILLFGQEPFSSYLRLSNIKEFKYDWYWDKLISVNFLNLKKRPGKCMELISVFYKKQPYYKPIMKQIENFKETKRVKNYKGKGMYRYHTGSYVEVDKGLRYPKQLISLSNSADECSHKNRVHITQKPVKLLKYFIETYSKEGDLVLDFTMGSGSTGVACKELCRDFIGVELDKDIYSIAESRIL